MFQEHIKFLVVLGVFLQHIFLGAGIWVEPKTYKSCPTEGKVNISFRNYCEMYSQCDQGMSLLEMCPDGLHFHPEKGMCDFPKNVKGCDPMDSFAPTTAKPTRQLLAKIQQNFDCDPVDVIVKRRGKRKCRVQVICSNGISFMLKRCMQTISLRI